VYSIGGCSDNSNACLKEFGVIVSMTGYGQGVASNGATTVTVEIRTVNHRFLDFSIKLPRVLQSHERDVKDATKKKLVRGRIYITMQIDSETPTHAVSINSDVMAAYLEQLQAFAREHRISADVDIRDLISLPDAVTTKESGEDGDALWALTDKALNSALDACRKMRVEEGGTLAEDLTARMATIKDTVTEIELLAPGVASKHAEAFQARIDQLMGDVKFDRDRMTSEIALMADRGDFTEEITRLRSHESQFNKSLVDGGEVSKKLTYLLQEMHREASTIGAKASDSDVIRNVVALKEETEKLREQVQNIE